MDKDPEAYHLGSGQLEDFLKGSNYSAVKQPQKSKVEKIYSQTRGRLTSYDDFLYDLGRLGAYDGTRLVLDPSATQELLSIYTGKGTNHCLINLAERIQAFARQGLVITQDGEKIYASYPSYPTILSVMSRLAQAGKGVKPFGMHNFSYCDFRALIGKYTPTLEDVIRPLPPDVQKVMRTLDEYARQYRCIPSCTTYWKINYKYKSSQVMCLSVDEYDNDLGRVRVTGVYSDKEKDALLPLVASLGEEFTRYFMRHLNYCTACAGSHLGRITPIFGQNKRLCAGIGLNVRCPKEQDIAFIQSFIAIRQQTIEQGL